VIAYSEREREFTFANNYTDAVGLSSNPNRNPSPNPKGITHDATEKECNISNDNIRYGCGATC